MRQSVAVREHPYPDDHQRLRFAVRDELAAQHGIGRRCADDAWIEVLADMVVARIDYGFDVRWAPTWLKGSQVHRWIEDGEHYVDCVRCRRLTSHASDADATAWHAEHERVVHLPWP